MASEFGWQDRAFFRLFMKLCRLWQKEPPAVVAKLPARYTQSFTEELPAHWKEGIKANARTLADEIDAQIVDEVYKDLKKSVGCRFVSRLSQTLEVTDMGEAFDRNGNKVAEAFGATKREVFDTLTEAAPDAEEIRIRMRERFAGLGGVNAEGKAMSAATEGTAQWTEKDLMDRASVGRTEFSADVLTEEELMSRASVGRTGAESPAFQRSADGHFTTGSAMDGADLLHACKVALNERMYKDWPRVADVLIAAIAKAEGGPLPSPLGVPMTHGLQPGPTGPAPTGGLNWSGPKDLNRISKIFAYHRPSVNALERITELRRAFTLLAEAIEISSGPSRQRAMALTELEASAMWAIKAVVYNDPKSSVE